MIQDGFPVCRVHDPEATGAGQDSVLSEPPRRDPLPMNLPFKPVGTHSTASLTSPKMMGTRWNASLPGSWPVSRSEWNKGPSMNRHADFSPQGPETDPRAWSFRGRPTSPRSCGLKSACRVRFMAREQVRKEQGPSQEPGGRGREFALSPLQNDQSRLTWAATWFMGSGVRGVTAPSVSLTMRVLSTSRPWLVAPP